MLIFELKNEVVTQITSRTLMQSQSKTYCRQEGKSNNYASMVHIISDTIPFLTQLRTKSNQG